MTQQIFKCELTNYYISYIITGNYAHMDVIICDYQYIDSFAQLLVTSVEKLKTLQIKYITQCILNSDKHFLNGTSWSVYNEIDTEIYIVCNIGDFIKNMDLSLGLTKN